MMYAPRVDVALLHDGGEAACIAEKRITAAGDKLVPDADGQVIVLLLPTARAAAEALAGSGHERALCIVDLCELQLDAVVGTIPLLEASWVERRRSRKLTVSGPAAAYHHARRVLDAIAPTQHAPHGHGFRHVHAIDAPLYKRWLTKQIRLEDVERNRGITLDRENVAQSWYARMMNFAKQLPFPQRPWADAAIMTAMREKRAPFGYLFLEWQRLKWKMLDDDEIWAFDSGSGTWTSLVGRAGIALVREGEVLDWIDVSMN